MLFSVAATAVLFTPVWARSIGPVTKNTDYSCSSVPRNPSNYTNPFSGLSQGETASQLGKRDLIEVSTYLHVVHSEQEGQITMEVLNEQMNVMNAGFAPHNIQFVLQGADGINAPDWANGQDIVAMKQALHQGDFTALNLYFLPRVDPESEGTLGFCEFPFDLPPGTQENPFFMDGCVLRTGTLPGGDSELVNLGATAVHEIGHWFGLYHTFQGGECMGPGDYIDDTPPQSEASQVTEQCEFTKDTCPGDYAPDPISNFMDYSADHCLSHFTNGQEAAMRWAWTNFRVSQSPGFADQSLFQ